MGIISLHVHKIHRHRTSSFLLEIYESNAWALSFSAGHLEEIEHLGVGKNLVEMYKKGFHCIRIIKPDLFLFFLQNFNNMNLQPLTPSLGHLSKDTWRACVQLWTLWPCPVHRNYRQASLCWSEHAWQSVPSLNICWASWSEKHVHTEVFKTEPCSWCQKINNLEQFCQDLNAQNMLGVQNCIFLVNLWHINSPVNIRGAMWLVLQCPI